MIVDKNKFVGFIIFIIFLLCGCGGGRNANTPSSHPIENNGVSKIEFLTEIHNFGTLKAGETVSFTFIFKNSGNKNFKINEIQRSCDCITAKYQDLEVIPGGNSEVEVILSTTGEWGNLLKTLEVKTSEGEKKILTVSAYVEDENFNNLLKKEK